MKHQRIILLVAFILLFVLPVSAQKFGALTGICPGDEDEEAFDIGETIDGRLRSDEIQWFTFEAEAGAIWYLQIQGDDEGIFLLGVLNPENRLIQDFEDSDLTVLYEIDENSLTTAFITSLEGVYCLILRNDDNSRLDYEIQLEPFPMTRGGELDDISDLNAVGFNEIGNWYYNQANYGNALSAYEDSLALNPNDSIVQGNACFAAYFLGSYDDALDFCDTAIDLADDYAFGYYSRGLIYRALGDYDEAAENFDEAIDISPDYVDALFERSLNSMFMGDHDDALEDMEEVFQLIDSDYPYWLGIAQLYADEVEDAIDNFEDSHDYLAGDDFSSSYPDFWLAIIADLEGEDEDTVDELFDAVLDETEDLMPAYQNEIHALVAVFDGDLDTAQEEYEAIMDMNNLPHNLFSSMIYLQLLGELYPDNEDFPEMLEWFEDELGL